jgi:hypothetical protein
MECRVKLLGYMVAGICLSALSGMVYAGDSGVGIELPTAANIYAGNFQSLNPRYYQMAANEGEAVRAVASVTTEAPAAQFEPPWLSGRKAHQYLGLGTVMFAGLTMLAAPEDGCETNCSTQPPRQTSGTTHTRLARTTAALAVATVMTGLIYHWNDIHWEDPFTDPDKMHARLAAAGALLMLYAVEKSAHSSVPTSHAGTAELGAAAMLVAIKLTW